MPEHQATRGPVAEQDSRQHRRRRGHDVAEAGKNAGRVEAIAERGVDAADQDKTQPLAHRAQRRRTRYARRSSFMAAMREALSLRRKRSKADIDMPCFAAMRCI